MPVRIKTNALMMFKALIMEQSNDFNALQKPVFYLDWVLGHYIVTFNNKNKHQLILLYKDTVRSSLLTLAPPAVQVIWIKMTKHLKI